MRDAVGSFYYINLGLVFFCVFASILAVAMNYTKAFRVKNTIINYIESNNGLTSTTRDKVDNYVAEMDYYVANAGPGSSVSFGDPDVFIDKPCDDCFARGYCICKEYNDDKTGAYYRVVTYMRLELPVFNMRIDVPISGQTKLLSELYIE